MNSLLRPSGYAALLLLLALGFGAKSTADDILIADFESGDYTGWSLTGEAFGQAPAEGTLPDQMRVSGYRGRRLVNTFHGGDGAVGSATSEPFTVQRSHIAFLIGGGPHQDTVGIELLLDGKAVRRATGPESAELEWKSWDVSGLAGKQVTLRIFDQATAGWGHINVDHLIQTNLPPKRFDLDHQLAAYRESADYMNEPLRPQGHFSPEIHWMNDPNGLVYHDGEYHLFHQYNPAGNRWGHMSWGHAVSRDLVHWEHLPLAIPEADGVMAFSGSCVVDHGNTSGFGKVGRPAIVAIYTGHGHGKQAQNLAYSTDNGRTWTKYAKNPVLDIGSSDFRDPKVFWHQPTGRWVMVVSLAVEKVLIFYGSDDLKSWRELSRFGPSGAASKPNWECPDLFLLPVEDAEGRPTGKRRWVLEADMGSGAVAGGSGGEYFVGDFDGRQFTATQDARWVDFGRDFYAPISWDNVPESDGRRIWIGWFNNWETCLTPTSPWRSCMSVPRTLSLRPTPDGDELLLVQRPVRELRKLWQTDRRIELATQDVAWPPRPLTRPGQLKESHFVLEATCQLRGARSCGFRIATGPQEFTEVGLEHEADNHPVVYVDRRQSGHVDFHPAFAGRHETPVRIGRRGVKLLVYVDRSTIEVFINDGEAVISDRIFPTKGQPVIEGFAGDDRAKLQGVVTPLRSIWPQR